MGFKSLKVLQDNFASGGHFSLAHELESIIKESEDKPRIVVIHASPRNKKICPGQDGKTKDIALTAVKRLGKKAKVDVLDLSVQGDGVIVQPCKGCVSTAGGYHCQWRCTCYSKDSKDLPDYMHNNDVYSKLEKADGFAVFCPINWYAPPTQLKAMFDRLVCANLTLTKDQAVEIFDGDIKDATKTRKAAKEGTHDHLLKNHLEGKFAAFYVHGDNGADDYENKKMPESWDSKTEKKVGGDPKNAILPLIAQCKYSGIFVPDDLVWSKYFGEGLDYATGNDVYDDDKILFNEAEALLNRLIDTIKNSKKKE